MMGIGAGMIWSTGIPLLMSLAPAYSGRITSLIESGAGIGITIGPAIGSAVSTHFVLKIYIMYSNFVTITKQFLVKHIHFFATSKLKL